MRCKNCGFENNEGLYICQNCGSPLYDEDMSKIAPEQEYEQKIAQIDTSDEDKEAAKKKRNIIITCVAAVLVVAIATAVIVFAVKGSGKEPTEPVSYTHLASHIKRCCIITHIEQCISLCCMAVINQNSRLIFICIDGQICFFFHQFFQI